MADKAPAFQFYPKDFLMDGHVASMTLMERGAYITLICLCWQDRSLPVAPEKLARMVGSTPAVFAKLWPALEPCFRPSSDGTRLLHPRLEIERTKQEHYKQRQSAAGRASVAARLQPEVNHGSTTVQPEVKSPSPSPSPSPVPLSTKNVESGALAPRTGSGVMVGSLPRDHLRHAVCGRVCLHESQFQEFIRKLGGLHGEAEETIRRWAEAVLVEWNTPPKGTTAIQGTTFQWWAARWEEWQGRPVAAKRLTEDPDAMNAGVLELLRKDGTLS